MTRDEATALLEEWYEQRQMDRHYAEGLATSPEVETRIVDAMVRNDLSKEQFAQARAEIDRLQSRVDQVIDLLKGVCHYLSSDFPMDPGECLICHSSRKYGEPLCEYHAAADFLRKYADGEIA